MQSFSELKLPKALERALVEMQFSVPTPIQAAAIPIAMGGADLVALAQTGTGKTAAFALPMATRLMLDNRSTALVLAPTRELAVQIEQNWKSLTKYVPELRAALLIGGASFGAQQRQVSRPPRLIIATPGRLLDHLQRRTVNLGTVGILVLDEADRMLDMGFAPQLNQIARHLPRQKQTLLFSATWDPNLDKFAKNYVQNPERVTIGKVSQAAVSVRQTVLAISHVKKNETLLDLLNERQGSILVFARTQARTDRLARYLNSYGMDVGRIHGGRSQGQRTSALAAFKMGRVRILVATDIAARGIDVADIAHVINYDLPMVAEDYIHRIGRTGRAGAEGEALSLVTPEERSQWNDITRMLKKSGSPVPMVSTPRDQVAS